MIDRRQLLTVVAGTGIGTPVFHRALTGLLQDEVPENRSKVTPDMVKTAEWISGTEFSEEERAEIAKSINRSMRDWDKLRTQELGFEDLPALHFQPLTGAPRQAYAVQRSVNPIESATLDLPSSEEDIAFLPVAELASLIRQKKISSVELTKLYLGRLEKYNSLLNCVVTMTDDMAMKQAKQADREISAGRYRGPLHGIPWGAKDLIAVPGYPTTWGIPQFENRELPYTATVARRLHEAGAVLVAKLSLGAIAMGDRWFRGMTRSPWNYKLGSSGSSAGSASATVAGLVGFALGSETLGSIISPARRCGATGHRPTFGRVSRAGCMPLSWSM
ncbi:MAG: amidase, partial [Pirellulaceae bacterium]|nr:amidase [Pirellulaceae bacterium]